LVQKLLRQGGELPDDIQVDLKDAIAKVAKHNKKTMHQAVNAMDNARQDYDKAVQARAQLHSQWRSFLAESLKLW
jgi:chemotaxis regulatin CheY-phosphate phosphatase CheZ